MVEEDTPVVLGWVELSLLPVEGGAHGFGKGAVLVVPWGAAGLGSGEATVILACY